MQKRLQKVGKGFFISFELIDEKMSRWRKNKEKKRIYRFFHQPKFGKGEGEKMLLYNNCTTSVTNGGFNGEVEAQASRMKDVLRLVLFYQTIEKRTKFGKEEEKQAKSPFVTGAGDN